MTRAHILKGTRLLIDRREYTLLRKLHSGPWQAEATDNGEIRNIPEADILEMYLSNRCTFVPQYEIGGVSANALRLAKSLSHFEDLPPHRKEAAKAKLAYIQAVEKELGPNSPVNLMDVVIPKVHKRIGWPSSPPHRITVYRWIQKYEAVGRDIRGLVDQTSRCGNREARLPDELSEVLDAACRATYLTMERLTYRDALDHAIAEISKRNKLRLASEQLPMPTLWQIKRLIAGISAYDRYAARYGTPAAERKFRNVTTNTRADRPLERVEIDHTRMDVFVIDEETMMPLGRPWLTLCVDVNTRAVLGYDLSFEPPSQASVARCLRMAILPKSPSDYPEAKNPWEMHGVMETLVVDNGAEFHSESLEMACLTLGITIQYCPRKKPWFKGCVERTQGTLNRGIAHVIPGTTFSNILMKDDYDPSKHAVVTLKSLRTAIYVWICDYYHQRIHRTLGDTPQYAWKLGTTGMQIPLPANPAELVAHLGLVNRRRLSHKGIELNNLFYNSEELGALSRKYGPIDLTVRFHHDDLGVIHIQDPETHQYFSVPAIDREYASGLTFWQHRVCRRFSRQHAEMHEDEISLAEAKQRILEIIQEDMQGRKRPSRVKSARFMNAPKAETISTAKVASSDDSPKEKTKPPVAQSMDSLAREVRIYSPPPVSAGAELFPIAPIVPLKVKRPVENNPDVPPHI